METEVRMLRSSSTRAIVDIVPLLLEPKWPRHPLTGVRRSTMRAPSRTGGGPSAASFVAETDLERDVVANRVPSFGLADQGIITPAETHWNLQTPQLVEEAIRRGEGLLAKDGPLVVRTGRHTGRSVQDKFTVRDAETESTIWWDNNKAMSPDRFALLKSDFLTALGGKESLFVADLYGGSQPEHRVRVRVINELAWHNLFIRTLLVRPAADELTGFVPEFTIVDLPTFR